MTALGVLPGVPDLVVMWCDALGRSRVLWIELKADKRKATPKQREFMDRAKAIGHDAFVCWTLHDVLAALKAAHVPHLDVTIGDGGWTMIRSK